MKKIRLVMPFVLTTFLTFLTWGSSVLWKFLELVSSEGRFDDEGMLVFPTFMALFTLIGVFWWVSYVNSLDIENSTKAKRR